MPAPTSLLLDAPKQLPMATAVCEANAACVCSNGSVIDAGYLSMSDRCGVVLLFYVVFLQSYVDDGVSQGRQATARHAKRNQELQRKLTNMLNTDRLYYAQQPVLCPALNHEIWQKQKKIFVLFSLRRPRWHCVGVWLRPSKHQSVPTTSSFFTRVRVWRPKSLETRQLQQQHNLNFVFIHVHFSLFYFCFCLPLLSALILFS